MKLLHIIPQDGIGGVEVAARSAALENPLALSVLFLAGPAIQTSVVSPAVAHIGAFSPFTPRALWGAIKHARHIDPDVIICSLWKTFPVLLLLKLFLSRPKFVLFLHSDRSSHIIEALITRLMIRLVDSIWADSSKTLTGRLGSTTSPFKTRVISFVLARLEAQPRDIVRPRFIFWGRLTKLKRIDRAIEFFAVVARKYDAVDFLIIGPDDGCFAMLKEQAVSLELGSRISFTGALSLADIIKASRTAYFYLQLSDQEGMAMSVVEAMQLGLVPVVTPVGEMARYCHHMDNSVVFRDNESALACVDKILSDPALYSRISAAATASWDNAVLYDQDLLKASAELVEK